jgi:hyaluronan synthase
VTLMSAPYAGATPATARGRSTPLRGLTLGGGVAAVAAFVGYVVWADLTGWVGWELAPLLAFFVAVSTLTGTVMVAGLVWRSFADRPVAAGRMIAIVPVFNEEPALLRATIVSLLDQTRVPDAIHVIDDGSPDPVVPFSHPLVSWHRQANLGKRHAQATVLRHFSADEWDYVLTVDSDSVLARDAAEHMLRSMSDPRVQAATGMILMRNWRDNLLARLTDINVVSSCLMFRMIRSWFGVVSPTSGCLALYRAAVLYDNLDDYVSSGTAGDDRRLSFYALLRGQVVAVPEAVVETELPTAFGGTFRQRTRWSKSAWLGIPFVLTNLRLPAVLWYMYPLVFTVMWPAVVAVLVRVALIYGNPVFLYGLLYWEAVAICMTTIYVLYRPGLTVRQRLGQWALAPIYPLFGLLLLRPAAYWALTQLKSTSWHTRGAEHTGLARQLATEKAAA